MSKVIVIGAGFAGVWTAAGIVRTAERAAGSAEPIEVLVVAPNDDMVVRPRMYETDPQDKRVPLDDVLGPIGVQRLAAVATDIDTDAHTVTTVDRQGRTERHSYDRLVVAAGSALVQPDIPGAEFLLDVDTMPTAAALQAHLEGLPRASRHDGQFTAVVVGAGFTGLEVVTELPARLAKLADGAPVRVILADRGEKLAESLGDGPREVIREALDHQGVEVRQGASITALDEHSVTFDDGDVVPCDTVVWTAGMRASDIVAQVPADTDKLGRLVVDEHLKVVGVDDVWATGDTASAHADADHLTMQACQHAVPLGKHAGRNVAGDLLGLEPVVFDPEPYVTCLDLGPGRAVFTTGWERTVEMTGEKAKQQKAQINTDWIYPPTGDRDAILELADHTTTWPDR